MICLVFYFILTVIKHMAAQFRQLKYHYLTMFHYIATTPDYKPQVAMQMRSLWYTVGLILNV